MKRSIHIEAPVEKVFEFVKDPVNHDLDPGGTRVDEVKVTEQGAGTYYSWHARVAGLQVRGFDVLTEVVPNKHITDRCSSAWAGTGTYDLEPEGSGTKLTLEQHPESFWRIPPLRNLIGLVEEGLSNAYLARVKDAIETPGDGRHRPRQGEIVMPALAFSWTVAINAPVEKVFTYLRDPENLFRAEGGGDPKVKVSDIQTTPDGPGTTGRNVFPVPWLDRLGITGSVINEITEVVPNRRIVVRTSPSMGRMFRFDGTWTWTFEPQDGGTKLTVDYAERANWLVYAFDRLTAKRQAQGFAGALATWAESGIRAGDASHG